MAGSSSSDGDGPLGSMVPLWAMMHNQSTLSLAALQNRLSKLSSLLAKYDLVAVSSALGGLLTVPENNPATVRIEALSHLAALKCRGIKVPYCS
jgi:hypothetical protein